MRNQLERFEKWFIENGGQLGENLSLSYDSNSGVNLRLSEGSELVPGSCIISCPHSLSLSFLDASDNGNPLIDQLITQVPARLSPINVMRFFLMEQFQLGELSSWWPYVQILPQPSSTYCFNTPLYYDEVDWCWIRGTSLEAAAKRTEEQWREEHALALQFLHSDIFGRYTWSVD